ncbi:hypothetical protein L1F30_05750 [Simiduia sp. 21SJ11W-1]|uniref:hypothetical protein n=1 Tax=Simiduia sp. 21SJ11W-1 TaxID=2909669 RepID=UPI00209E01B2|nr:hypothetical protein [Simiduia sp. 21SJ11W-1]UTA49051.1 hypothetical protein L1F30_05750 [Simiduia sp. 21SJ11W-1]
MKPVKTKAQIRDEINNQIANYLSDGGEVLAVPRGISGREPTIHPPLPISFDRDQQNRTPVTEVISAIEQRRQQKHPPAPPRRRNQPRKKLIYDDFGQPLRWQWVED